MRYLLSILIACLMSLPTMAGQTASAPLSYHSLSAEFSAFFDETATMPRAARVAAFKERFGVLFPGFYSPAEGQAQADFDASIAQALDKFPALRPQYEQVEREFPQAFAAGITHFQKQFPGFKPALPVWFVHSLGRMDGGSRTFDGKTYMIFGADVIARTHADGSIGPFLDHELFHMENGRWFKDCIPETTIWCSLWQEGTAVYAASVMNPGATDHMLLLDQPRPIRADVDASWRNAVCQALMDFDKSDLATYGSYFFAGDRPQPFPRRWGYYLGYRLVERIGRHYSLSQISRLDAAAVRPLMIRELDAMAKEAGGCGQ